MVALGQKARVHYYAENTAQPTQQRGLNSGNQAAAQPMPKSQPAAKNWGWQREQGKGKRSKSSREVMERRGRTRESHPERLQSTKEGAFSKGCANSGARTGLRSSWELASGREKKTNKQNPPQNQQKPASTGASICPVSLLALLAWQ